MTITCHGITEPAAGLPIINRAIQHAGLVYLCEVTPDAQRGAACSRRATAPASWSISW